MQEIRPPYPSPIMQQWDQNFRGLSDRQSYLSRRSQFNNLGTGYQSDLIVITDGGQHTHPYILDWYYTALPQRTTDRDGDIRSRYFDSVMEHSNEASHKEQSWGDMLHGRVQSQLEASTSTPLLRELVMQDNDSNKMAHPSNSHWWARSPLHGYNPETSFLEPPNFDTERGQLYDNYSDNTSTDEPVDWRDPNRLSRTFLMDDLGGEDFSLPFDDIYRSNPTAVQKV